MKDPSSRSTSSSGSDTSRSSAARRTTCARRRSAFSSATRGRVAQLGLDAVDELPDRALFDRVLAECGQDVRDVFHERAVRPDHEDAAVVQPLVRRVEQPRGAVQADGGLAGARAALDDKGHVGIVRDQPVLVGLDRRDDVAHVASTRSFQLLQQEVTDGRAVEHRPVERLVGDVEKPAAVGTEAATQRDAVRVVRRRRIERPRCRRLPVHDDLLLVLVVHPAASDVERPLHFLEVEPPEAEPALGVLVRAQAAGRPGVDRSLRDLTVDSVARARDGLAHPLEMVVRPVDVRLLLLQVRVAHVSNVALRRQRDERSGPPRAVGPYLSCEPSRVRRARSRSALRRPVGTGCRSERSVGARDL